MKNTTLSQIAAYCDRLLHIPDIKDYDGAVNGLQVENCGAVTRIGAAVDATLATVNLAAEAGCDLLLVHHGLFWRVRQPWTGSNFRLVRKLLESNLAVYSAHLPLDMHPTLGNNAQLSAALGFKKLQPFFPFRDQPVGLKTTISIRREELQTRLEKATGSPPHLLPCGPAQCKRIGIVTGGAGGELPLAGEAGIDTFITGEGPHWSYAQAEEFGLNVFYGGHYATETFGVKALAAHLSKKFNLPWTFLEHPTGL
jgi:dinuclear metal center YbgI/SA1388 family protein